MQKISNNVLPRINPLRRKSKNRFVKALSVIFIFFLLVLGVLVSINILPFVNWRVFTVQSGSMRPAFDRGSIIVVRPEQTYGVGDVITFRSENPNNPPITHRIHSVELRSDGELSYTTKGDANEVTDFRKINKDEIIGKQIFYLPYIGHILNTVRTPLGFVVFIVVPGTIIIYREFLKIVTQIKHTRLKRKVLAKKPVVKKHIMRF